jgi:hypothetical protein
MPQSPMNNNQNTFASLPDLSSFNYSPSELSMQDNSLMVIFLNYFIYSKFLHLQPNNNQHNLIGALKPTHYSTSPTRNTTRYSPTHSNRRLSPQRSDKYVCCLISFLLDFNFYFVF